MGFKSLIAAAAFAVGVVAAVAPASATTISADSSLQLSGGVTLVGGSYSTATGVHFLSENVSGHPEYTFLVPSPGSGDLAVFPVATFGTMLDITFAGFTGINDFYTLSIPGTTLSFDLDSISPITRTASLLGFTGTGVMHMTGFDDTPGTFSFTVQDANAHFSFSASAAPSPVPEPASIALLGAGLAGLGMRRKKRAA